LWGIVKKSQYSNFSAEEWLNEGKRLTEENRHREAIEAFNLAIQKNCRYGEAYFARGACHYVMGNYRQTGDDLNAAALFGCREAQFWSIFSSNPTEKSIDENEN
jgi:tetratricopeptide (TPR) repeat protein